MSSRYLLSLTACIQLFSLGRKATVHTQCTLGQINLHVHQLYWKNCHSNQLRSGSGLHAVDTSERMRGRGSDGRGEQRVKTKVS